MPTLELREHLGVRIEVLERERAFSGDADAPRLPLAREWDEIARRGQLDVDAQLALDQRQRLQQLVLLGLQRDVDVDRRRAPPSRTAVAPPAK